MHQPEFLVSFEGWFEELFLAVLSANTVAKVWKRGSEKHPKRIGIETKNFSWAVFEEKLLLEEGANSSEKLDVCLSFGIADAFSNDWKLRRCVFEGITSAD